MYSIDRLKVVAQCCRSREPIPESVAVWLATSLQSFLDHRACSLNEAFGVCNARGGIPWHVEASNRERDEALRLLANHFPGDMSLCARAANIQRMSVRYAAGGWRFDRERDAMPESYRGVPQELLWRAFKSGANMPLGARQLRNILAS